MDRESGFEEDRPGREARAGEPMEGFGPDENVSEASDLPEQIRGFESEEASVDWNPEAALEPSDAGDFMREPGSGDSTRVRIRRTLPSKTVAGIFGAKGKLATAHPSYERRQGQEWMALAVEEALRLGRHLLIEAGTGVGKTLAYLVPAALSGKRIIVSTGTKNLQDQILDKDLPFVTDRLGIPISATVVKGRDNYLCIRRFRENDRAPLLPTLAEAEAYESVRRWAASTEAGDRAEIVELPEDASFWRRINARGDTCTGTRCEDYESCFLTKVRRKAAESRLVVVNHHLFFADLALREDAFGKVLPDYDAVVFDEAHLLEEVATMFFGVALSSSRVLELADDAERMLARGPKAGPGTTGARETSIHEDGRKPGPGTSAAREGTMAAGSAGAPGRGGDPLGPRAAQEEDDVAWIRSAGGGSGASSAGPTKSGGGKGRARSSGRGAGGGSRGAGFGGGPSPFQPVEALRNAAAELFAPFAEIPGRRTLDESSLGARFEARYEGLSRALESVRASAQAVDPQTEESVAIERRCRELGAHLSFVARAEDEAYVYWVEVRGRTVILSASPVDVSSLLDEMLFAPVHAAVLTSATLSVDEDFSFVRARLGIQQADERVVPSPFDYATQGVLYLPAAMPEPRDSGYRDRSVREIEALIRISEGRAFLLFTSYAELRRVEGALRGRLRFPLLVQGEKPRGKLLEEFRTTKGAVLLGAASFWHGVDVPGDALSLVVIDKIPFEVPNDPLVAARIARIRALGGDPFRDYQIPAAAIELKQGLGRLIRARSDRGILAILDARLNTRSYGRSLLAALPPFPVVSDIEQVRSFFEGSAEVG